MKNYYIADMHFSHAKVIEYDKRPFDSIEQMEDVLIQNWNQRVCADDTVYILGDFCIGPKEDWLRLLPLLKGKKVLIVGNHDHTNRYEVAKCYFENISFYQEITDGNHHIILSHYPILFYRNSSNSDVWNFCGHVHNQTSEASHLEYFINYLLQNCTYSYDNKGHILNIGAMMPYINYVPQTAEELISSWNQLYRKP